MSKSPPPIPPEQANPHGATVDLGGGKRDRRDAMTELQSGQPGDADTNLAQQGRHGNTHQNVSDVRAKNHDR